MFLKGEHWTFIISVFLGIFICNQSGDHQREDVKIVAIIPSQV
jgi:hypothetical protein